MRLMRQNEAFAFELAGLPLAVLFHDGAILGVVEGRTDSNTVVCASTFRVGG